MNRLLFPQHTNFNALCTPRDVVSRSEHAQIEDRLTQMVQAAKTLRLDLDSFWAKLNGKPMRLDWIRPGTQLAKEPFMKPCGANLVICCTASSSDSSHLQGSADYVQGAADDSESWSLGLDPAAFWAHQEEFLSASEDGLPALIEHKIVQNAKQTAIRAPVLIRPTDRLSIGNNQAIAGSGPNFDIIIMCTPQPDESMEESVKHGCIILECTTGKVGSRQLRMRLPVLETMGSVLGPSSRVLVTCETGRDIAVGVALAVICLFFQDDGKLQPEVASGVRPVLSKAEIKQRLSWIMVSMPDAAPSRATLQSVNAFLMG